jgi:hypothetical protein
LMKCPERRRIKRGFSAHTHNALWNCKIAAGSFY